MGRQDAEHHGEALAHGRQGRVGHGDSAQLPAYIALQEFRRQEEHRSHGDSEDQLDDGGLELEEDGVVEDEGERAGYGEEQGVGGHEGIGLPVLDEDVGELGDARADSDEESDCLPEKGIGPDEEGQGYEAGNKRLEEN